MSKKNKIDSRATGVKDCRGKEILVGNCVRGMKETDFPYFAVERNEKGAVVLRRCFDKTEQTYPITDYTSHDLLLMTMNKSTLKALKYGHQDKICFANSTTSILILCMTVIVAITMIFTDTKFATLLFLIMIFIILDPLELLPKFNSYIDNYRLKRLKKEIE